MTDRRIAHAVRGLKSPGGQQGQIIVRSHRSRGAWIEIRLRLLIRNIAIRRIAHAVRGLKSSIYRNNVALSSRIAHAVRGLK